MNQKRKRRSAPNLMSEAKVFSDHGFLYLARSFEKYEMEKQNYRETGDFAYDDPKATLVRFWPVLDSLIRLPEKPSDRRFKELAHSKRVFELTEALSDIENEVPQVS